MDNKFLLVLKILVGSSPTNEPLSCLCRYGGMVDTTDLKSVAKPSSVPVRVWLPAPLKKQKSHEFTLIQVIQAIKTGCRQVVCPEFWELVTGSSNLSIPTKAPYSSSPMRRFTNGKGLMASPQYGLLCRCDSTARISVFQTDYGGSIPLTCSINQKKEVINHGRTKACSKNCSFENSKDKKRKNYS